MTAVQRSDLPPAQPHTYLLSRSLFQDNRIWTSGWAWVGILRRVAEIGLKYWQEELSEEFLVMIFYIQIAIVNTSPVLVVQPGADTGIGDVRFLEKFVKFLMIRSVSNLSIVFNWSNIRLIVTTQRLCWLILWMTFLSKLVRDVFVEKLKMWELRAIAALSRLIDSNKENDLKQNENNADYYCLDWVV